VTPYGMNREFALCETCGHPRMAHYGGGCHCGCSRARSVLEPRALAKQSSQLSRSRRFGRLAAKRPTREPTRAPTRAGLVDDLVDRVRSAAFSSQSHRRGWDAVRTAALLRREGSFERALKLLDDVVTRFGHGDIVSAAYACAVAIHCDLGDPATGIAVGRTASHKRSSAELNNALVRAYWERYEQTNDASDLSAWRRFKHVREDQIAAAAVVS